VNKKSRYTLDTIVVGQNGVASLRVTLVDNFKHTRAEPIDISRTGVKDAAAQLSLRMDGAAVKDVEGQLLAEFDGVSSPGWLPIPLRELWKTDANLRESVIDGLLRRGQVGNLISTSKSYKTYLVLGLAISMAVKRDWLDRFPTIGGRVLLIDLELQRPDITRRTRDIVSAMHVPEQIVAESIDVLSYRGRDGRIETMEHFLLGLKPRDYSLVIVDPLYKTYPEQFDENSNAQMTGLYRRWERMAEHLDCAMMIVHHGTKGSQSEKRIVDVGAGASAQSRSADCHIALREHEVPDCMVLDAKVRSFKPVESLVVRWDYPLWHRDISQDPSLIKTGRKSQNKDRPQPQPKPPPVEWTTDLFVEKFLTPEPASKESILAKATKDLSERGAQRWLTVAVEEAKAYRWQYATKGKPVKFSTLPQPVTETV
jgi:hypothetical protein